MAASDLDFDQRMLEEDLFKASGKGLKEVSTSVADRVQELLTSIKRSVEGFGEVADKVELVNKNVSSIQESMDDISEQTKSCSDLLNSVSSKVESLKAQFSSVDNLLRMINNISDQTHILSLNATIEAARAGEAGKGFSVVANEVKELSKATKNVNQEIQKTLLSANNSVRELFNHVTLTLEKMGHSLNTVDITKRSVETIGLESREFENKVSHFLRDFDHLDKTSGVVSNQMTELSTIGDTFKFLLELISMRDNVKKSVDPLKRLGPVVANSTAHYPQRFIADLDEYKLTDDEILISATDTRGVITFANNLFYDVAQYPYGSLIGKPHNIIRHPDMPKLAFADLWKVIKEGKCWQGYVCNKGKEGRIYWVLATVFPCYEYGKLIGYISLRTRPDSTSVEQAKLAYRKLD